MPVPMGMPGPQMPQPQARPPGPPAVPPPQAGGLASMGGNPQQSQQLLSMLAGVGLQNILSTLSKFMKTASTVGMRQEKPVRIGPGGQAGPADMMAARGMSPTGASQLPLIGAAMMGQGGPPPVPPPGM